MLGKLRGTLIDIFANPPDNNVSRNKPKYPYSRPDFLDHNEGDLNISSDKEYRPIILPRKFERLPCGTGYAEAVNAGKTSLNEDQAQSKLLVLTRRSKRRTRGRVVVPNGKPRPVELNEFASHAEMDLPVTYFGIFDGHAGVGAALYARHELHQRIMDKLTLVREFLFMRGEELKENRESQTTICHAPTEQELVCGVLESAFDELDENLRMDATKHDIPGGCTAVASVFLRHKLYVANAGDSRAVVVLKGKAYPMSFDFTPASDRRRIQLLAEMRPELLGGEFCPHEFCRRIFRRDINSPLLHRHAHGDGWAVKICTEEDLRFPLIYGFGKKSRLMGTIGVSRGFGDHSLRVFDTDLYVKPFLTSNPEIRVLDLEENVPGPNDVLIMATDGLWDVCTSENAAEIATRVLSTMDPQDRTRYMVTAQELVMHARGTYNGNGWRQGEGGGLASGDDISAFVIPLLVHQDALASGLHYHVDTDDEVSSLRMTSSTSTSPKVSISAPAAAAPSPRSSSPSVKTTTPSQAASSASVPDKTPNPDSNSAPSEVTTPPSTKEE